MAEDGLLNVHGCYKDDLKGGEQLFRV